MEWGFNGAATFRSRKVHGINGAQIRHDQLQWGRDLSVAEGLDFRQRTERRLNASMGPRPFGRGRCARPSARLRRPAEASMGPRPFGRGRRSFVWVMRHEAVRFNGAATFRSRKARVPQKQQDAFLQLQWGRDLSVAEGRFRVR